MDRDHVDEILQQWRKERPDVDVSAMAVIGRISRLERVIAPLLDEVFAAHGLESWEFDMLATLRRHGEPHRLTAGQLMSSMMITSGAVTNRIDRLEGRGLIRRERDPADGRIVLVTLTDVGLETIDKALPDHAANELALVSALDRAQRETLEGLLRELHLALTGT